MKFGVRYAGGALHECDRVEADALVTLAEREGWPAEIVENNGNGWIRSW